MDTDQSITQSQLEGHLSEAANILRGPVDASDFKTYIFPLLFFRRISDVYDDEVRKAEIEYGEHFPEDHRFQIPEGAHWNDVRAVTVNIGSELQRAFREIEAANQSILYNIFGDAQWSNKDRLSDALLRDLIDHFSKLNLANGHVEQDALGRAYEFLIKKFADLTNKKAGEFYTPRSVVRLMVNILDPHPDETIYDPACGTGGMLLEAVNHIQEAGARATAIGRNLYGQEKNLTTESIARINLLLHGLEDFKIVRGDTLRAPAFYEGDRLMRFDCVIANPPFSLERWGDEVWENDPFGRAVAGLPPKKNGDFAWVQHMLSSMAPDTGRMAVVLPHGVLFRTGQEGKIRRRILELDLLDSVIGLGPNLFYGTGLAACILIFRTRKFADRHGRVLMIDGSGLYRKGRNQNMLEPEHSAQILEWYQAYRDIDGVAKVVSFDEIAENDFNVNISRYVEPIMEEERVSVEEALANLKTALNEAYVAEDRLQRLLKEVGLME